MSNKLIINADDFGLYKQRTDAINEAFKKDLISSTTVVANGEALKYAYSLAKENKYLGKVGLHINFTEGEPLTEEMKNDGFFCENGKFINRINRRKKPSTETLNNVKRELQAQIDAVKNAGFTITHADSHHHIHTDIYLLDAIAEVLLKNGIYKIRIHRNFGKINLIKKIGKYFFNKKLKKLGFTTTEYFGGLKDVSYLKNVDRKSVEIMVHPDYDNDGNLIDVRDFTVGNFKGELLSDIELLKNNDKLYYYKDLR